MKFCFKNHKDNANGLIRPKRVVPLLFATGYLVIAGMQAYTLIQTENNAANAETLAKNINDGKELMKQAGVVFNKTRDQIHGMSEKLIELEKRIDFLDQRMDVYPKIMALISDYESMFNDISDSLKDIDKGAVDGVASASLNKLVQQNLWIEPAAKWSIMDKCMSKLEDNNLHITYKFSMPITEPDVKILRAEALRFYNYTERTPNAKLFCWMYYSGPKYILVNLTNNCHTELYDYHMKSDSLRGWPCTSRNQALEPYHKLYSVDSCTIEPDNLRGRVQVKDFNGFNKIYCFQHEIAYRNKNYKCPEYVFELPITETFKINEYYFRGTSEKRVLVNTAEIQMSREIASQIKTDSIKIVSANLSHYDKEVNLFNYLAAHLGVNVTLNKVTVPEVIKKPIEAIKNVGKSIWSYFETWAEYMLIIAGVILFIIAAPLLEIFIIIMKMLTKFCGAITRAGRVKNWRFKKTKNYWNDDYKVV